MFRCLLINDAKMADRILMKYVEFAIANVQCQYESECESVAERDGVSAGLVEWRGAGVGVDHTYDGEPIEPPAFIIKQIRAEHESDDPSESESVVWSREGGKLMSPSRAFTVQPIPPVPPSPASSFYPLQTGEGGEGGDGGWGGVSGGAAGGGAGRGRVRRSEGLLRQAADCVSSGLTFQHVSNRFNIPISTIRFFMARKGILPKRRRGRSNNTDGYMQ